jgi:16S rRNA G966 N2-methylase RsmD
MARKPPEDTLNELDGKSWVKATKSWFIINPRSRKKTELEHPAKFPEELVERLVSFFTKSGEWIIDPFAGVGSTILGCNAIGRNAVGIELNPEFVEIAEQELKKRKSESSGHVLQGDSRNARQVISEHFKTDKTCFSYLLTSPPYFDMLRKSRGGNISSHKERAKAGLRQSYSELDQDIGNISDYSQYLESVTTVIANLKPLLCRSAYLTIIAQNMRDTDGTLRPIAWDLARNLSRHYTLRQEMIWCQDNKRLGCWGYPTTYVSNVHHHHCIILQKDV